MYLRNWANLRSDIYKGILQLNFWKLKMRQKPLRQPQRNNITKRRMPIWIADSSFDSMMTRKNCTKAFQICLYTNISNVSRHTVCIQQTMWKWDGGKLHSRNIHRRKRGETEMPHEIANINGNIILQFN